MAMGLLPEIERAWIAIDHQLFLWDYNEGYTISRYDYCVSDGCYLESS